MASAYQCGCAGGAGYLDGVAGSAAAGADYETARELAAHPANAVALVLFLGIGFWHMALGLQVVLEDYVSHELARMVAILLVRGALVLAVATILAVLRIMLA